jgi:ParB family chromosome partitioning protein
MASKRQSLGTGLDALLGFADEPAMIRDNSSDSDGVLLQLPVEFLQRGKYQPRRDLDPVALQELAQSITQQGVMQPIVVRKISNDKYEIIAGERRWRATQQAGLDTIPAVIRKLTDEAAIAMALIENIQREDLNAIEESRALIRLHWSLGMLSAYFLFRIMIKWLRVGRLQLILCPLGKQNYW